MEGSESARSQGKMEFPKFGCVCELCDCGRHKHHKGCSKRNAEIRISWGSDSCPLSHYKATFTWPHKRKHSCKRLPLSLALGGKSLLSPQPRQTPGPSNQRVPKPLQCSSIQSLAPSPEEPGTPAQPGAIPQNGLHRHNTASSCYSYQRHRGAPCSNSFPRLGELPAVVGSLLYPDPREKMETTNNREFFAKTGGKPERKPVVQCSLTLEGERELVTTHREQFQSHPIEGAPVVRRRQPPVKQEKGELRGPPMECITRYSHDFPPRQSLPEKRTPVLPRPDNLAINPALRSEFRTVQMDTYPGWDILEHPRPTPAKLREELSVRNSHEQFQGDTVTKLDFQPIPLTSPRLKPKVLMPTLKPLQGPFDDRTANRESFKDWGVRRRVRHGDCYDGIYVKPVGKFESETTNSQTFFRKQAERVANCKPQHKAEGDRGQHSFATEQREAYRPISLPVCQLQLYLSQNQPAPSAAQT